MKIAICGPGGSGKDTVAKWFGDNTTLVYKSSTSYFVKDYVFAAAQKFRGNSVYSNHRTAEDFYNDRVNHRLFWADRIDEYNSQDAARLYRECAREQDIITGIRKRREFVAAQREGVFQLSIWINRKIGHRNLDSTQEYGSEFCDLTISNTTLSSLFTKLTRLAQALQIYVPCKNLEATNIELAS